MKHTHTHTWQKAQKVDFCLESSSVIRTLAAESCRLRRVSQTDIAVLQGGLLSWWDEERLSPSVKFQHPSLPLKKGRGNGALSSQGWMERGREKIEQDQFMIQLCVREDFPESRCSLAGLKGASAQTQTFLNLY